MSEKIGRNNEVDDRRSDIEMKEIGLNKMEKYREMLGGRGGDFCFGRGRD